MPIYKNRPAISGDTPVWRYLSLSAVLATIKTRQLRLTRVDKFHDPFEGSVPKSQIEQQNPPARRRAVPVVAGARRRSSSAAVDTASTPRRCPSSFAHQGSLSFGAVILALGIVCWLMRDSDQSIGDVG